MRTKEEYYEDTLKNRALLESQEVLDCSCPYSRCEWHGKCRECVALHRYHAEHLPCCLQPLLREKITVLRVMQKVAPSDTKYTKTLSRHS